jgi:hypothetical protein
VHSDLSYAACAHNVNTCMRHKHTGQACASGYMVVVDASGDRNVYFYSTFWHVENLRGMFPESNTTVPDVDGFRISPIWSPGKAIVNIRLSRIHMSLMCSQCLHVQAGCQAYCSVTRQGHRMYQPT